MDRRPNHTYAERLPRGTHPGYAIKAVIHGHDPALNKKGRFYEPNRKKMIKRMQGLRNKSMTFDQIAQWLEDRRIKTPSRKTKWYGCSVQRILTRAKLVP
jgi:hypothetical protein